MPRLFWGHPLIHPYSHTPLPPTPSLTPLLTPPLITPAPPLGEDRMPRLFLGQSFLVVLSTFLISQLTTFVGTPLLY